MRALGGGDKTIELARGLGVVACASASHQAPACSSTTGAPHFQRCLDRLGIGLDEHGDPNPRGLSSAT